MCNDPPTFALLVASGFVLAILRTFWATSIIASQYSSMSSTQSHISCARVADVTESLLSIFTSDLQRSAASKNWLSKRQSTKDRYEAQEIIRSLCVDHSLLSSRLLRNRYRVPQPLRTAIWLCFGQPLSFQPTAHCVSVCTACVNLGHHCRPRPERGAAACVYALHAILESIQPHATVLFAISRCDVSYFLIRHQ